MALYFSSRRIPQLSNYSFTERAVILSIAQGKMPVPRRLICNMAKLVPICLIFFFIVDVEGWWKVPALLAAGIGYPLFTQPITLNLSLPYLDSAIKQYQASASS